MCKIKGERAHKNHSLYLDYESTVGLLAQRNILQYGLETYKGNPHKESLHFPENHDVF